MSEAAIVGNGSAMIAALKMRDGLWLYPAYEAPGGTRTSLAIITLYVSEGFSVSLERHQQDWNSRTTQRCRG